MTRITVAAAALLGACLPAAGAPATAPGAVGQGAPGSSIRLVDATRAAGIDFVHDHGGSGRRYFAETVVPGVGFLDYDGDGSLDAFMPQGAPLPGHAGDGRFRDALYRGRGDGTFEKVTSAGIGGDDYGFGVASGDVDNDGAVDLLVTTLGGATLYRNNGDGTFSDITDGAGVAVEPMTMSAAFLDYDRDGWVDLFIARYMDYALEEDRDCEDSAGRAVYCSPTLYEPTVSALFRNEANGSFTETTGPAGIDAGFGRAMGVAPGDWNEDGLPDLYVAVDLMRNYLFLNEGDGTFRQDALATGTAVGRNGHPEGGMGLATGDVDNDGRIDLLVTNFEGESNTLYRSLGDRFEYLTRESGLARPTRPYVGWGVGFVDLDLDGRLDLFTVNGHIDDRGDRRDRSAGHAQPARVYRNVGDGELRDVSASAGPFFSRRQVARGAAFGDHDNDGDTDVLIAVNDGPAILLENRSKLAGNWVRLRLVGRHCNRDALGTRVELTADGSTVARRLVSGTSYLSEHDRRLLFGIGRSQQATVTLRWPCGREQQATVEAGGTEVLREHAGA